MERAVFLIVIVVLAYFAFFKEVSLGDALKVASEKVTGAVAAGDNKEDATVTFAIPANESAKETPTFTVTEPQVVPVVVETPKVEEPVKVQLSGNLNFNISSVSVLRDSGNNLEKMQSVTYVIDNQKYDSFKPLVKIYWYDSSDDQIIQTKVRADLPYDTPIKGGITKTDTVTTFTSKYFNKASTLETLKLELYDRVSGELLRTATKVLS